MNEENSSVERENKIARLRAAIQALPGAMEPIIKVINAATPELQRLMSWFNSTGYHITYNHPPTKHNGRRRSRREMRDHRQQAHFIHLADTIRKDGEQ
jgi:hypothetical protein